MDNTQMEQEQAGTPWTAHVAAVLYCMPLPLGAVFIPWKLWAFWGITGVVTLLVLQVIYGWHGRYRQYARLYLLLNLLVTGLLMLTTYINAVVKQPASLMASLSTLLAWNSVSFFFVGLGAFVLTPGRTSLWLTRTIWKPIYPESVLPQELTPVEVAGDEDIEEQHR